MGCTRQVRFELASCVDADGFRDGVDPTGQSDAAFGRVEAHLSNGKPRAIETQAAGDRSRERPGRNLRIRRADPNCDWRWTEVACRGGAGPRVERQVDGARGDAMSCSFVFDFKIECCNRDDPEMNRSRLRCGVGLACRQIGAAVLVSHDRDGGTIQFEPLGLEHAPEHAASDRDAPGIRLQKRRLAGNRQPHLAQFRRRRDQVVPELFCLDDDAEVARDARFQIVENTSPHESEVNGERDEDDEREDRDQCDKPPPYESRPEKRHPLSSLSTANGSDG